MKMTIWSYEQITFRICRIYIKPILEVHTSIEINCEMLINYWRVPLRFSVPVEPGLPAVSSERRHQRGARRGGQGARQVYTGWPVKHSRVFWYLGKVTWPVYTCTVHWTSYFIQRYQKQDPDPEFWKPDPVQNCLDSQHYKNNIQIRRSSNTFRRTVFL